MLIVRRSKPTKNFLILPNGALFDERLGYIARGVLHELLGRPPGWQANADSLSANAKRHRGSKGEGRRAMREAFAEMEAAGYLVRSRGRVPKGEPNGGDFVTILTVYDIPQDGSHGGTGDGTSMDGTSMGEWPMSGTSSVRTDTQDENLKRAGQHASSLAAAREGGGAGSQALRPDLQDWYDAANKLSDDRLRRHLLAFERKRPQVYREKRQRALAQLKREDPAVLTAADAVRAVDLLSFKYALLHYVNRVPDWLIRLPR